jgi:translation initiation factor IF-2
MGEHMVGKVTHYFNRIGVAAVRLDAAVATGDTLRFVGQGADFYQQLSSLQIGGKPVEKAEAGQEVGIKVESPVKQGTAVYRVES